jgi:hypothetical protein
MANVTAGVTILSSAGVSPPIMLDPTARTTSVLLNLNALLGSTGTGGTGAACDVTIQQTFDTWYAGGPAQLWSGLSTSHYSSATDTSSVGAGTGTLITVTGPIAGLRLSSSNYASSATGTAAGVVLKALQSVTAGP